MEFILIMIAIVYVAYHAGHSHANYRHLRRKYRGHLVNLWFSTLMGPWISVRIPGTGFRIGHRL